MPQTLTQQLDAIERSSVKISVACAPLGCLCAASCVRQMVDSRVPSWKSDAPLCLLFLCAATILQNPKSALASSINSCEVHFPHDVQLRNLGNTIRDSDTDTQTPHKLTESEIAVGAPEQARAEMNHDCEQLILSP